MIDGEDIKGEPSHLFKTGQWSTDKDVIIGHTDGEMNIFEVMNLPMDKALAEVSVKYSIVLPYLIRCFGRISVDQLPVAKG